MKRYVLPFIFVSAILTFGVPSSAATIDLISQTYTIGGNTWFPPGQGVSYNITGNVPPLEYLFPNPDGSNYGYLYADGGASGSSAFVDLLADFRPGSGGASADLVFKATGTSDLDLSYKFSGVLWPMETNGAGISLVDITTGVTLMTTYGRAPESLFDPATGLTTLIPGNMEGSFEVPVIPSDIYKLSADCGVSVIWDAGVAVTLNAVPEPTTLLLLGFGLVGLVGFRRKLLAQDFLKVGAKEDSK